MRRRARNLFLVLSLATAMATGSMAAAEPVLTPKPRVAEVRDSVGRTWAFAPTRAALARRSPAFEL